MKCRSLSVFLIPTNDSFRCSIRNFVNRVKMDKFPVYTMTQMCSDFGFHKRRLYDAINVFEAIGCCKKTSVDTIIWNGVKLIPEFLEKSYREDFLFNDDKTDLDVLFNNKTSISISHLTVAFIMCFLAMETQSLNIKKIASFLSMNNGRTKTTLCKLYQITHILDSLDVIEKSSIPGEVTLLRPYYTDFTEFSANINTLSSVTIEHDDNIDNPLSLKNLLSRSTRNIIRIRRNTFNKASLEMKNNLEKKQIPPTPGHLEAKNIR
ncbi:hypothetical protein TRFO_11576 [Tritrichomonas foetus]|uniref:E2F/DP family winged-helix DNA-binding domain-containing protein n=1 Tax=Tritrichomonas foetus TaxID=1144522 RepID=A0A1J4J6H5_9EUKA|nr:hypothetical protein TRFO_11576 [Tritrichomonas foetus]|eukprot:OHS93775.1 hypothetical protein TRFO_11576 [Tritrichomonas foetus]